MLIGMLALLIFLPAGTARFWQGWSYLAAFGGSTIVITLDLAGRDRALLARRLEGGPRAETRPRQRLVSALANVAFLALYLVAGLDERFGWSAMSPVASFVADLVVVAGFLIVYLTFRANSYTSATVTVGEGQTVVDRGPYALVRHPMYAGAFLLLLASPVALDSSWAFVPVVPLLAAIVARLLDEERFLAEHLQGYAAYSARVRARIVPFIW
jgi:protein-S-isoprenylcysteine O-methyltransferase Ste14